MFNNERRTSDAGKSYLPFALGFSLVVRKYKQLMFAEALGVIGLATIEPVQICICIVRIRWGYAL